MKEQITFSPPISSFVLPLFSSSFKDVLWHRNKPSSVPLMKALAVCCHCEPRGVDDQHQLRLRRMEGDLCVLVVWIGGRRASGSRPYMFAFSQLRINAQLTNPLYTGAVFSVSEGNTVTFSCTLNAVKDRLCFCYSDKSSCSLCWVIAEPFLRACPLIVIQ